MQPPSFDPHAKRGQNAPTNKYTRKYMSLLVYLHAGVPEPANKCPHTARVPEYMYGMQAIPQAYPYSAHCRL